MKQPSINWASKPCKDNYLAAISYLRLIYSRKRIAAVIKRLKHSETCTFKAKDIFRASGLSLLGVSNSQVIKFQQKIKAGEKVYPILLVRDPKNGKVVIADGYHRTCAVYTFHENEPIHCRIV
jgi:hypothetical protein